MEISNKILLRKRTVIEFVNDFLKNICQIKHSRHKSCCHFVINLVSGIIAYSSELQPYINPFCFSSCNISTHTPLAGCNDFARDLLINGADFYSHTPHGVQHTRTVALYAETVFLLTHPSRGATINRKFFTYQLYISTHTPLTGCNRYFVIGVKQEIHFYSHTPHGVQHQ